MPENDDKAGRDEDKRFPEIKLSDLIRGLLGPLFETTVYGPYNLIQPLLGRRDKRSQTSDADP